MSLGLKLLCFLLAGEIPDWGVVWYEWCNDCSLPSRAGLVWPARVGFRDWRPHDCRSCDSIVAITDHLPKDIITNVNQTTTDPTSPSVSAPKTHLAQTQEVDQDLYGNHKSKIWRKQGNKDMQKNLLKQQFETFTIGSREELDSAYERFQHILSMLELHEATVSIEDANLNNYVHTHVDEELLQIMKKSLWKEIDIRWQVAMITARIRKFMQEDRKESIDSSQRWNTLIKESRANGHNEKMIVAIEDNKLKSLAPCTWTRGLDDFDWSNKADDAPVSLALMATNSEDCEILRYQMSLESLEVMLKTHEKNEYAWGDKYEQMEYDLKIRDLKLEEKQKELDQALKERDDFKVKLEKWSNASVLQNEVLNKQRYVSDSLV
ncbi:hypothetical protein Tco_0603829 [Tanacetum coccineum]